MRNSIVQIMQWLVYTNLWIAAAAVALCWQTYIALQIALPYTKSVIYTSTWYALLGLVGAATIATYTLARLLGLPKMSAVAQNKWWVARHRKILRIWLIITALAVLFLFFVMPWRIQLLLLVGAILTLLYLLPVYKFKPNATKRIALRELGYLKIFIICFAWVLTTVWLPAALLSLPWHRQAILLLSAERALFIFAITLPFDIRDLQLDAKAGLHTLPAAIGIKATYSLATLLLGMACLLAIYYYIFLLHLPIAVIGAIIGVYSISWVIVRYSHHQSKDLYYTFGIDGTMLLYALVLLFFLKSALV